MKCFYMIALISLALIINTAQAEIINGDFENGNLNEWIASGYASNDDCAYSHNVVNDLTKNSLVADLTATGIANYDGAGASGANLSQTFYASAGGYFTFDYRAILPTEILIASGGLDALVLFGSNAVMNIRDARLSTLVFEKGYYGTTVDTDTGWQSESIGPFPHDGLYTVSFNLNITNYTGRIATCSLFLDNINAPGVPEPSTVVLLLSATLGGLLWWRRRC
jgi:hypothetical protein